MNQNHKESELNNRHELRFRQRYTNIMLFTLLGQREHFKN